MNTGYKLRPTVETRPCVPRVRVTMFFSGYDVRGYDFFPLRPPPDLLTGTSSAPQYSSGRI